MITALKLSKRFGPIEAVRQVSFTAADGRITGLLGPNGAGKSTTLRLLYTVLRPDAGDALIDGVSAVQRPLQAARRLGVLTHGAGLYPNLTARENIRYFAALQGLGGAAARQRTDELVRQLDMADFADRRARGFSQGQRVKTALARSLVHRPQNLILDEPTNGLDVMAVRALRALLMELRAQGHCVLFSSHVMPEVAALSDEIVVIGAGRVLGSGTPAQLRARTGTAALEDAFVQLIGAPEA